MKNVKGSEIRFLKVFVYMMGFVLMFATVFLTYIAYEKAFSGSVAHIEQKDKCTNLNLSVAGRVQSVSLENGFVNIMWRDENGMLRVSIYDYCNGNLINDITVSGHGQGKSGDPTPRHEDIHLDDKNILS